MDDKNSSKGSNKNGSKGSDNNGSSNSHENGTDIGIIAGNLLDFYDQFSEFHDYCAFLCDSFGCLVSRNEPVETSTANGVMLFTDWMKYRARLLEVELNDIRKELNKLAATAKLRPIKQ